MTFAEFLGDFRNHLEQQAQFLSRVPDDRAAARPFPGKWSAKEILGHLIDSASNNHQRFVRATIQNNLVFLPYDQNRFVDIQNPQSASWRDMISLWRLFNLHIAHLMEVIPEDFRLKEFGKHNFDQIAWKTVSSDNPATLDYFMNDYVGHLKHHGEQMRRMLQ